ncbi:hypothetical protein DEEACLCL_00197 [Salmonella phage CRW-SP2]|nr:hypothetical protein DEEACLCL_00197 [Salmonella phage CRW-SP2]
MPKSLKRAGVDTIDLQLNPTDELLKQIDLNREFVEHMLAKPEGDADNNPDKGELDND